MLDKDILLDTKAFAKKLYNTHSEGSPQDLLALFERAEKAYRAVSYIQGRLSNFEEAKATIRDVPTNMMQAISLFVSTGAWDRYSSNTLLMLELIKATGHQGSDDFLHENVVVPISRGLCVLIGSYVNNEQRKHKELEKDQQQRDETLKIPAVRMPHIMIAASYEQGRVWRKIHSDKSIFCLQEARSAKGTSHWQLTWFDLLGNPDYVDIDRKLSSLLAKLVNYQLPDSDSECFDQLTYCCNELIPSHANVYVFDNSQSAVSFARKYPDKYSFCLSPVSQASSSSPSSSSSSSIPDARWQLAWYDRQGRVNPLPVPAAMAKLLCLETQLPSSDSPNGLSIKEHCLVLIQDLLSRMAVRINPPSSSLPGTLSTFVLTHNSGQSKLDWYDSLGKVQLVSLDGFPELAEWLASQAPAEEPFSGDALLRLKTYLMHLTFRREVDAEKQTLMREVLLKKHGLSLVVSNNMEKIPRFRLIPETYFLVRENMDSSREWVLYQRIKGVSDGGVNMERIDTEDWKTFHQVLAAHDVLPEELPDYARESLRRAIRIYEAFEKKKKTRDCYAVSDLSAIGPEQRKPGTFIVSKAQDQWLVHYVDTLQRLIPVDGKALKCAAALFATWQCTPGLLTRAQLSALSSSLSQFNPSSRLNMADFSDLEKVMKGSLATPVNMADFSAAENVTAVKGSQATPAPGRLQLSEHSLIGDFFSNRAKSKTGSVPVATTSSDRSAPEGPR